MKKRSRNRVQNPYTLKDMYNSYKSTIEEGSPYDISKETFVALCEDWFKYISDKATKVSLLIS